MNAYKLYDLRKGTLGICERTFRKGTNEPRKLLTFQERQKSTKGKK